MDRYWFPTCSLCGRVIPSVLVVATIALLVTPDPAASEFNLPLEKFAHWADEFGAIISGVVSRATGEIEIRSQYVLEDTTLETIDGEAMVKEMKLNMEKMLQMKVDALSSLVRVAEEAHSNHVEDEDLKVNYPKAKKLNTTEFHLEENEHFNYIPVNLDNSTVHVPTNVYDESADVLNGVAWSVALDEYFKRNYEADPTLTWQYFGSASGFFRNYPGAEWQTAVYVKKKVDIYDSRSRGWYIQAATSPKDIVILLDASGSMKGLRMEIAKATVKKILETLSDDDFFNVIKFSKQPQYVDDCFNGTMVQANADNKKRVNEALNKVSTADIAHFDKALVEAFELLAMVNETGKGAQCNRAIMLITDGAPETYEEIFKRYNWPQKSVRVFTYLIGREVGDSRQVHWMACSNKGYYSHISTLADVHENVQKYINVISRPMVIDRADHTIWTNVYVDAAGLQLMTSVAAPVYDTRNITTSDGILLGVMGTDVPLKELTKLTPKYKLGVNGYAFAITNNGYVLFHPDFRPTEGTLIKPNYNSVDLAEVELEDTEDVMMENDLATPHYDMKLRRKMVDRVTGQLSMRVKIHYDGMKRITTRDQHYYFTRIDGTPFSLGIALPDGYGEYRVNGSKKLNAKTDLRAFTSSKIKVANWNYCKMDTNETRHDPALMLRKYMEYGKQGDPLYERCDKELIESILFDAVATRGALSAWMKDNRDGTSNDSTSKSNCTQGICQDGDGIPRNGVEVVFLGTKGGLTRYATFVENLTDPHFIDNNTGTIEEQYYIQAVEGGDKVFTFSIPFNAADLYPNIAVTASTPIVHRENNKMAVAMVVGLQMRYEKFYEFFMNSTTLCRADQPKEECNLTCFSHEVECYLLDNNGYVVLSESPEDLGKFYGTRDRRLMMNLLYDPSERPGSKGVFKIHQMFDYQGVCKIWDNGDSGARSIFINPFLQLTSILWWFVNKLLWFIVQFSVLTFSPSSIWAASESKKVFVYEYLDSTKIDIGEISEENLTMCDVHKTMYRVTDIPANQSFQYSGKAHCPNYNCSKSFSINRVVGTNLMLLVVDAICNCDPVETPMEPIEFKYNESMMCTRLQTEIYRKRPSACYAMHVNETDEHCAGTSLVQFSSHILHVIATLIVVCGMLH